MKKNHDHIWVSFDTNLVRDRNETEIWAYEAHEAMSLPADKQRWQITKYDATGLDGK